MMFDFLLQNDMGERKHKEREREIPMPVIELPAEDGFNSVKDGLISLEFFETIVQHPPLRWGKECFPLPYRLW